MNITQLFDAALLAVGLAALGLGLYVAFSRVRARAADDEARGQWEAAVAAGPRPAYDGDTYAYGDWPETGLAKYLEAVEQQQQAPAWDVRTVTAWDMPAYLQPPQPRFTPAPVPATRYVPAPVAVPETAPLPVTPPSSVSGPLPSFPFYSSYDPAADAESYIKGLEADTTDYIARMSQG